MGAAPSREGQGSNFRIRRCGASSGKQGATAHQTAVSMAFADENGPDPADVHTKAATIRVPYDNNDPIYWFRRLEIQMEIREIKSQFWKRIVLESNLPPDINETIKDLLIKERN